MSQRRWIISSDSSILEADLADLNKGSEALETNETYCLSLIIASRYKAGIFQRQPTSNVKKR